MLNGLEVIKGVHAEEREKISRIGLFLVPFESNSNFKVAYKPRKLYIYKSAMYVCGALRDKVFQPCLYE